MASVIDYLPLGKRRNQAADEGHQYGHGKYENLASLLEALLILAVAAGIFVKAIPSLLAGGTKLEALGIGTVVMGTAALVNLLVSNILLRVAKETDSAALEADG